MRPFLERHWLLVFLASLTLLVGILYAPVFKMGFVTDDFIEIGARNDDAVDFLAHDDLAGWGGQFIQRALIDPVSGVEIFRPTRQVIFWADYFMWHLNPLGYHITNLLFLVATCFVVALLAWHLTRRKSAAIVAGLLFALMPVHTAPIAEVASRGHVIAGFFVALTVLFYVLPRTRRNRVLAVVCCILAIGSKETALITPALLGLYEIVYHRDEVLRAPLRVILRQLPFWLCLAAAIGLRFLIFGRLSSSQYGVGSWNLSYQAAGYTLFVLAPFLNDISDAQTIAFWLVMALLVVVYRARREVAFGVLWVPLALFFTLASPPQERYFYTPSVGLVVALASILSQPFPLAVRWSRWAGALGTAALLLCLSWGAWIRVDAYRNAGEIVQTILAQVKTLHPTLPRGSQLVFVGIPEVIRQGYIFNNPRQVEYAIQWLYDDRSLRVKSQSSFPTVLTGLDKTFFLEYDRRKITERADLVQSLRNRLRCSDSPKNWVRWNFDKDAAGWEPWNEIDSFQPGSRGLRLNTTGNDPFMGSPFVEISPQQLRRVEIRMSAQAAQPTFLGELYWQTAAMSDFDGSAHVTFPVKADGELQTYTLRLNPQGAAPIIRLRLDPSDVPAKIELEQITLYCK